MPDSLKKLFIQQGDALFIIPPGPMVKTREPIRFFMTPALIEGLDEACIKQAINGAGAPGVIRLSVGPDGHAGHGVPVGTTMVTKDFIYPGLVGPDICCSMSYLQTNVLAEAVAGKPIRRALIEAIDARIPTGSTNRLAPKGRGTLSNDLLSEIALKGPSENVLSSLGIPTHWAGRCETQTPEHQETQQALSHRWEALQAADFSPGYLRSKIGQVGSYGGGNHFGEGEITQVTDPVIAEKFGLKDGHLGFLNHCGSRGFGARLADKHFRGLADHFARWAIPLPGGDKELVYAPIDSQEGQNYLADMTMGAHVATVNHLLLCQLISEACTEVLGAQFEATFVYHIGHNIGRKEMWKKVKGDVWDNAWVWRKGATRAFPPSHPSVMKSEFRGIGHPILLPGNPSAGSRIMVAKDGAKESAYSINHGAGRAMGRNEAFRQLTQESVHADLEAHDILFNSRNYPIDEAPAAYKDFNEVCDTVEKAGLATTVATLKAILVIKDNEEESQNLQ